MKPTTVFGIDRNAEISELSEAELVALWHDIARHYSFVDLRRLEAGAIPQTKKEEKYQEVYNEMKKRGLI